MFVACQKHVETMTVKCEHFTSDGGTGSSAKSARASYRPNVLADLQFAGASGGFFVPFKKIGHRSFP